MVKEAATSPNVQHRSVLIIFFSHKEDKYAPLVYIPPSSHTSFSFTPVPPPTITLIRPSSTPPPYPNFTHIHCIPHPSLVSIPVLLFLASGRSRNPIPSVL